MKIPKLIKFLLLLIFISCILLVKIQFGSYSVFHLFFFLIVFSGFVYSENHFIKNLWRLDNISISIVILSFVACLSYIFNISNVNLVSETYSTNSEMSPTNLYWKIMINGLIFLASSLFSYQLGKTTSNNIWFFKKVFKFIFVLCLINAFANVITWVLTTGGIIGRYNFEPPITFSPGVSIIYSSIGFLLGLPILYSSKDSFKKLILKFMLAILFLSILIILTRQGQISFIIMLILYHFKTSSNNITSWLKSIPILIFFIGFFLFIVFNINSFSSYLDINSTESTDVAVRLLMLTASYDIFLNNPFFGIGYGMFVGHNTVPVFNTGTIPIYLSSPHNGMAAILVEFGIIGAILFLYISYLVVKTMSFNLRKIKDQQIYRYCSSIYVIQVVLILSVFISNSNLFGPPSEISYLYLSFISWFMIGSVVGVKESN